MPLPYQSPSTFTEARPSERWQRVVEPHLLAHLLVGEKGSKGLKPIHLLMLVWLLAAIAVAAPSWRMAASPFEVDNGLVVLLRTGSTMLASDVQPSRLERAKHKLRDLLAERRGKSTGLIVYSGSAHLVMPLTRDERVIPIMLEELTPEDAAYLAALPRLGFLFASIPFAGGMIWLYGGRNKLFLMAAAISSCTANTSSSCRS